MLKNSFSLTLPDTSALQTNHMTYDLSHQELLRESRHDTLLSRYTLRDHYLEFNHVNKKYSLFASWEQHVYGLSDLFKTDYTLSSPEINSYQLNIKAQAHYKNWLIQPGLKYSFGRTQDTLFITDFPSSDVLTANTYFFDLLPETIGDTLLYHNDLNAYEIELLTSGNLKDQNLFFYLNFSKTMDRFSESHDNTSSNDKINGPRETLLTINYSSIKAMAGWQINAHSLFWTGLNYHVSPLNWKHTVFPDEPDTTEVIQLANGKTNSFHAQFGYRALSLPVGLQATLSTGLATNISHASTPVLGYVLRILPISHQANFEASSRYLLTHIHLDHALKAGSSIILPKLDVIAARFWTDVSLEALLQFGLEDIDFQEQYVHAAYIASLGIEAKIALNSELFLTFEAEQMIPYVKTVFPEPPTPIPSDIKRYGGLTLSAGVSMAW